MCLFLAYLLPSPCLSQVNVRKRINAKYCDKFAHVVWKDGRVMHVHVTHELHRDYRERLAYVMADIQRRLDSLSIKINYADYYEIQIKYIQEY